TTPDGRRIITGGNDQKLHIWDIATGKKVKAIGPLAGVVRSFTVSTNGRWAATAYGTKAVQIWDLHTGKPAGNFVGHSGPVLRVAFAPGFDHVLSGTGDPLTGEPPRPNAVGEVILWDIHTRKEVARLAGQKGSIVGTAFSPCGQAVAIAS